MNDPPDFGMKFGAQYAEHPFIHTYVTFLSGRVYCSFEMLHVTYERNYTVPV